MRCRSAMGWGSGRNKNKSTSSSSSSGLDPTRKGVDWYRFFAQVIADGNEDPDDYARIIHKRTLEELKEPEDKKYLPLLALAKDKKKWFR